jgi:FtsP/CotA-like multicopper oxidase with cupredoxin domain
MLWYHDHGMDHTAENVHAGLAGLYFIRDEGDDRLLALLGGAEYEVPLVVQDRLLAGKGEAFNYQTGIPRGDNRGEFLGTVLFTNGRPSPKLRVQRRYYRLRLLNGSNARTYALALYNPDTREWLSDRLTLVGTEGGLLAKPLHTAKKPNPDNGAGTLVFAPAERRDVLLDLHGLEGVERLQLVNLAVKSWVEATASPATTEGIYTTAADSIVAPADVTPSYQDLPLFRVLDLCLQGSEMPKPAGFWDKVRDLALHADEDGFHWNHVSRSIEPNSWAARKNRLILLWNNTLKDGDWDVRLCEMGTEPPKEADCSDGQCGPEKQWLPFDVNLAAPLPAPDAQPAPALHEPTGQDYYILRRSFFKDPEVHCDSTANFPELHKPNIVAKAGTYERWYIANVGNEKFGGDGGVANNPDMHPMHIHLVNFIVTRRWKRDDTKQAFTLQDRPLPGCCTTDPAILDRLARWDTVRVHPNEIVELLVYFPKGYQGQYPYHCHLVEHEDMGMMLHFEVE